MSDSTLHVKIDISHWQRIPSNITLFIIFDASNKGLSPQDKLIKRNYMIVHGDVPTISLHTETALNTEQ